MRFSLNLKSPPVHKAMEDKEVNKMGGQRKHGPVEQTDFSPTKGRLIGVITEIEKGKQPGEYTVYKEVLAHKDWNTGIVWLRQTVSKLKEEGHLDGPYGKFRIAIPLAREKEEIPLGARKYLSAIDQRIRELKSKKQKIEEETKRQIGGIDSSITHWQEIRQRITQEPELSELFEELTKL